MWSDITGIMAWWSDINGALVRIIEGGIAGLERDGDVFRLTVRCLAAEQY